MTIALVGSAFVPAGNPTTGFTCTIDAAVATDDLIYLALTSRDSTSGSSNVTCTDDDSGGNTWSVLHNTSDKKAWVFWKRATSGTASKTITVANCVGSSSGVGKAFSGGDTGATPHTDLLAESNASGNETHGSLEVIDNVDSMLCATVHNYANDNAVTSMDWTGITPAVTMTEKLSTGGSDCATAFGHVDIGSDLTAASFTWAQTDGTTYSISWAIKPAAAPASRTDFARPGLVIPAHVHRASYW